MMSIALQKAQTEVQSEIGAESGDLFRALFCYLLVFRRYLSSPVLNYRIDCYTTSLASRSHCTLPCCVHVGG